MEYITKKEINNNIEKIKTGIQSILILDEDGDINLSQVCKKAGKSIHNWKKKKSTVDFLAIVSSTQNCEPGSIAFEKVKGIGGTSALYTNNPQVVLELLRWLSPMLAYECNELVLGLFNNPKKSPKQNRLTTHEILKMALEAEEERLKLEAVAFELESKVERDKPKVQAWDEVLDRNLLTNLRDTAKELGVGQKDFISLLLSKKYIYRDMKNQIKFYSQYDEYFVYKEFVNLKSNKGGLQTMITAKGREHFIQLIKNQNQLDAG